MHALRVCTLVLFINGKGEKKGRERTVSTREERGKATVDKSEATTVYTCLYVCFYMYTWLKP